MKPERYTVLVDTKHTCRFDNGFVNTEMYDWLYKNCTSHWEAFISPKAYASCYPTQKVFTNEVVLVSFESADDAIRFRLTWE